MISYKIVHKINILVNKELTMEIPAINQDLVNGSLDSFKSSLLVFSSLYKEILMRFLSINPGYLQDQYRLMYKTGEWLLAAARVLAMID